jgi:ADP-heptose:LPS heptosyltransferase
MPEPRFLVVRLGSLGDIVHTFPAVAALRETFPQSAITWLTHPRWETLVRSSSLATDIWAAETRSLSSIREIVARIRLENFSTAIDYQGLWKSAALPLFGGVPRRIGFSSQTIREWGVPILYTDRVRCVTTHIAEQNGELSQRAGARQTVAPFTLQISPQDDASVRQLLRDCGMDRYILLSPGGGWRSKCWPPDRFGDLSRQIRDTLGLRCVINYGPGEEALAESIKVASRSADPVAYSGTLEKLMALARNALCVVGGDTGPLHLAVAVGTPSVSIYGPTDPARNGPFPNPALAFVEARHVAPELAQAQTSPPYPSSLCAPQELSANSGDEDPDASETAHRNVILRAPTAIRDHSRIDETDPAILKISVDEVFAAVRRIVGAPA